MHFTNRKNYLNNHLLIQDPLMRRIEGSHIVPPGVILNHNREEFALILSPLNVYEYRLRVLIYIKPNGKSLPSF